MPHRRTLLRLVPGALAAAPLLAPAILRAQGSQAQGSQAQGSQAQGSQAQGSQAPTPLLLVHGNGDHAALWMTTIWRWESNGWPRDRLRALDFTDPLARNDDAVPQPLRSGTDDALRELRAEIAALRARTGAARIALIGNSRGGYPIRNHVVLNGGGAEVSHGVLCGTPNRGVYDWEFSPGGEFNGRGPFLRRLNGGDTDVVPGTAFLTIRSDGNDVYAQPDGRFVGRPGTPTGITAEGPELRGATNVVLPGIDHRETAYSARAFREMFRFVAGREPDRLDVTPEARVTLNGRVTGTPGGVQTNRPVAGATVEVFRVDPATAARTGEPLHRRVTGEGGAWGPATVPPDAYLEIVVTAPDHPTTHFYRTPFPRSSEVVNLRPAAPLTDADRAAGGVIRFTRPRGYFGLPRDVVLLDGREPTDVPRGVAAGATTVLRLPTAELGRPVAGIFNLERLVSRAWPAAEGRVTVAELTW
ncbi:hydrolase [Roseomonas sp. CCTCC AB2023176]|uniref:hydrolase n=1 Tax=Roseomonas sp. CCTCC AB2023176 TaxID=3342640 RepID=UPI0035DA7A1F